jgi:hypothetical protein
VHDDVLFRVVIMGGDEEEVEVKFIRAPFTPVGYRDETIPNAVII